MQTKPPQGINKKKSCAKKAIRTIADNPRFMFVSPLFVLVFTRSGRDDTSGEYHYDRFFLSYLVCTLLVTLSNKNIDNPHYRTHIQRTSEYWTVQRAWIGVY